MITRIYAVKDTKTTFWKPWTHHNDQSATREFASMVNAGNNVVADNPGDYELWYLGDYDDYTGKISPACVFVVNGTAVKKVIE